MSELDDAQDWPLRDFSARLRPPNPSDDQVDEERDQEPPALTQELSLEQQDEPEPEQETEAEPESEQETEAEPEPELQPSPAVAAAAAPPEGVPPDQPIWDRRNRRYVLWHSKAGRWLTHTEAGWAPFERAEATDATPEEGGGAMRHDP